MQLARARGCDLAVASAASARTVHLIRASGRRVFWGSFWFARTVRYPTRLHLAGAQVWSLAGSLVSGSSSEALSSSALLPVGSDALEALYSGFWFFWIKLFFVWGRRVCCSPARTVRFGVLVLVVDLDVSLAVSVVAEGVDDVEAVGVVDAEAEGVAKLDHGVLADVEVVVVVDAGGDGVEG